MKKWYIMSTVHMHHKTSQTPIGNPNYREYTVIEGFPITIYSDRKPVLDYIDLKLYLEFCFVSYSFASVSPFIKGSFSLHNLSDNIVDSLDKEFIMWPEKQYTFKEYCNGAYYVNKDTGCISK